MRQQHNTNDDFEALQNLYIESYNFEKDDDKEDKEEDEDKAKDTIKEGDKSCKDGGDCEDDETIEESDEEGEDDEETIEEGMWDRAKAHGASIKSGVSQVGKNIKGVGRTVVKGGAFTATDPKASANSAKHASIVNSHMAKIEKALSNFATDVTKLKIMDDKAAEKMAERAYSVLRANPYVSNLIKKGKPPVQ